MSLINIAKFVLLGAIWGASFMLIKWSAPEVGVMALVEVRAIGAALVLLPIVYLKKQQADLYNNWYHLLLVGLFNTAIPFCLFNYALLTIDAGLAAILNATAPMFGVLVAYLFLRETVGWWGLLGILLGFVGVVLISYEQRTSSSAGILAVLAILGATMCYALTAAYLKHFLSDAKPFAIAGGSQIFTALILLPFVLTNMPETLPSNKAIASTVFLAFVCTGIAYILYFDLIAKIGVSKTLPVGYLIPLFGVLWGYLFLGESLSMFEIAGAIFVLFGVMLATNMIASFRRNNNLPKTISD